jgi:hypothetical protein
MPVNGNGNGNGDGFWRDMPWWVKAIAIVGVPSIISIGVVYSDRVQLLETLFDQTRLIREVQAEAVKHIDRDTSIDLSILEATKETNRILLAECVNNAKNEISRERCIGR